ncbi:hypothetical protein HDU92_007185 [Lobulomyces angularis]|nr:hypothetical protein HDU92_007185 [Lobulomyces angularis]
MEILKEVSNFWLDNLYNYLTTRHPHKSYTALLERATNYSQWHAAAERLDKFDKKVVAWKNDPVSPYYEYQLIQDRLDQLKKAREAKDLSSTLFLLRTSLTRNLGNMTSEKLHGVSKVGTKKLIEVCSQLQIICETDHADNLNPDEKYEFFMNTQKSFGRTALLLSGGAVFGLSHIGVVKALLETKLLPRIISGASVGSIIAAVVCTKTDEELAYILHYPNNINLDVFERPDEQNGWLLMFYRILHNHVVFEIEVLIDSIRANVGDLTFQEAYYRTRRILNITVSSSTLYEMPRILNYLTAPNVLIYSAVAASCAIPGVYKSYPLMHKDRNGKIGVWNQSGTKWIDGSVESDLPMARITELFGVNHFIVSQVNPHVLPVMKAFSLPLVKTTSYLLWSEVSHWIQQAIELGLPGNILQRAQSMVRQRYTGDITIIPSIPLSNLTEIMGNPNPELILYYSLLGEAATYKLIGRIKTHCQIELVVDEMLYRLRIRKLSSDEDHLNGPAFGVRSRFKQGMGFTHHTKGSSKN